MTRSVRGQRRAFAFDAAAHAALVAAWVYAASSQTGWAAVVLWSAAALLSFLFVASLGSVMCLRWRQLRLLEDQADWERTQRHWR